MTFGDICVGLNTRDMYEEIKVDWTELTWNKEWERYELN